MNEKNETISRIKSKLQNELDRRLVQMEEYSQDYTKPQLPDMSTDKTGIQNIINELIKNVDLTGLIDTTLHFNDKHRGFLLYLFNKQITQNYLSAFKYYALREFAQKQTWYNQDLLKVTKSIYQATQDLESKITLFDDTIRKSFTEVRSGLQNDINEVRSGLQNDINEVRSGLQNDINQTQDRWEQNVSNLYDTFRKFLIETQTDLQNKMSNIEQTINNNTSHLNDTVIILSYNTVLKRNPAPWEHNLWSNMLKSGVPIVELMNKLRMPEEFIPLKKNFLVQKNIIFETDKIAYKKFDDHVLYFDVNDHIITEQFTLEYYEKATTEFISRIVKKGMNVINIGANMGYYVLLLAKLVGKEGQVYAFEPFSNNLKFLEKNVKSNNYKNIRIIPKAVLQKSSKTKLWLKGSAAWNFISDRELENLDHIEVETTSIDEFFKDEKRVDFIMMDAEGSEKFILDGMHETIKNNPKLQIVTEYNPYILELAGTTGVSFLDMVEKFGFSIFLIDENQDKIKLVTKDELLKTITYPRYANIYLTKSA